MNYSGDLSTFPTNTAEELEYARRMAGEQKIRAACEMFDEECRVAMTDIHRENPSLTHAEVQDELRRTLVIKRADNDRVTDEMMREWARGSTRPTPIKLSHVGRQSRT